MASATVPPLSREPFRWDHEVAEVEALESCLRGWWARFTRLAPGQCPARLEERALPSLRLVRLVTGGPVAVSSRPLGELEPCQLAIVSPEPGRLLFDGTWVGTEQLLVKDGSEGSNFVLPAGFELLVVRLDRARLDRLSRVLYGGVAANPSRRLETYRLPPPELDELRTRLRALLALDPQKQPHLVKAAEQDLYERVAWGLCGPRVLSRLCSGDRRRVLRDAETYVREHSRERFSLTDLCHAARCSERTLRYAFHQHYGVSPVSFVKRVRLQGLRRELLDATPRSAKVIDLALRWGFWHQGHLSRDYRRLFGETPVDTLLRRSVAAERPGLETGNGIIARVPQSAP